VTDASAREDAHTAAEERGEGTRDGAFMMGSRAGGGGRRKEK
jgi:hypothetical protein